MPLIEDLIDSVKERDAEVRDVVIGPAWTLVASIGCGVASNFRYEIDSGLEAAGELRHKPLGNLLELAPSTDPFQASIGIAALNSAIAGRLDAAGFRPYSIPRARDKFLAVVGDFPFIEDLERLAAGVAVIDRPSDARPRSYADAEPVMRRADIAIITGSAIVDGTLEYLLGLTTSCFTIVFGPSTPLSPILFDYGADQLVGILITNEDSAARCVSQGTDNLSECQGVKPVVLGRNQQSR